MFAKKPLFSLSAAALLSAGLVGSAIAGTAQVSEDSKDSKKQVIQQKAYEPKFYFSLGVGTDLDYRATAFSEEASPGLAVLPPTSAFSGGATRVGTFRVERRRYDAAFPYEFENGPYRIQGEFGYVAGRYGEIFGMVKYTHMGSNDSNRIGTATFADQASLGTGVLRGFSADVLADFDDYNSIGVELGFRLFFLPKESRFRPYVSFAAGATYVDNIDARFFLRDGTTIFSGGFYQGGVVATGSLLTGVEFALTKNFSIGAEGGARYEFPLNQRDRDLDLVGLGGGSGNTNNLGNSSNNAGDRFYLPVTLYGKFRF